MTSAGGQDRDPSQGTGSSQKPASTTGSETKTGPESKTGPETKTGPDDPRDETEADRLDRNFDELLQEVRVSQTGTQILFAFLLGVAYTDPFRQADSYVHAIYSVTLLLCAVATALFIAPVALHRTWFRQGRKGALVEVSSRLALSGLYVLLLALTGAVLLALDNPLGRPLAVVLALGVLVILVILWIMLPIRMRVRRPD